MWHGIYEKLSSWLLFSKNEILTKLMNPRAQPNLHINNVCIVRLFRICAYIFIAIIYIWKERKKVFAGVKYNIENVSNITLNTPNDDSVILHSDFYDGTYIFFPLYSSILCVIQSIWFLMSIFVISFIFGVWIFRIGFHFDTWINILCVSVSRPWCACICVEI